MRGPGREGRWRRRWARGGAPIEGRDRRCGRRASALAGGPSWRGVDRRTVRQGVAEHGAVRAARAGGEVDARQPSQERAPVAGRPWGDGRRRAAEEATGTGERGGDLARGEQAEVPNLHEAPGQNVEQEAPEEFAGRQGDAAAILGGEANGVGGEGLEAVIGEPDAVSVAAEVADDLRGAAEGALGVDVDDPLLAIEVIEERAEGSGVGQRREGAGEVEVPVCMGAREGGEKLPRKSRERTR